MDSFDLTYSYENDSLFAPLSTAIEIAENINKSNLIQSITDRSIFKSTSFLEKRIVKNDITIMDKEKKNPYFYVINFESGGFTIIPADRRLQPILGYSEKGYFDLDSIPFGMERWFEENALHLKYLRSTKAASSSLIDYQWANLQCIPVKGTQCPPPIPPEYSETVVTVGPLLPCTWDQGNPYNNSCPVLSGGPNGHAWTGCSTTAIAQVMYYWKYPSTYNWSQMSPNNSSLETQRLMGDIFPNVIGNNYDEDGSACTDDYKITHTLLNTFNYHSASLAGFNNGLVYNGGYDYQTVVSNLTNREPVILGGYKDYTNILGLIYFPKGAGHTWVCDGYIQTTTFYNGLETAQYLRFSMNWGWSGRYNGWYDFNNWSNPIGNFHYFPDMIYNIHP
jgi:Peptidase C10 family/Spi protease inhibitor